VKSGGVCHPPVDCGPKRLEHAVHRRQLHVLRVVGVCLELVDVVRLFERPERQMAEVLLQDADAAAHRVNASETRRLHVPFEVRVEEC
jgi:hypothetical protein